MSGQELFKTAPDEVVRYFRAKRSLPSFDWRDVAPEEHAFSWTVAKSMERDVLDDIRAAVDDAIVNRVPFEQFRQRLMPILQEKGWWGRGIQTDPKDGVPKVVQLGSPRRLRTIYWANTRTAHAAGEWERTQRTKRFLPFLLYTLSRAERRRPEHERLVGTVLPVDDPFWDTHYPPNGWGCLCGVRQISEREARRLGWSEETTSPEIVTRRWTNKRTGETVDIPVGIDPGWQGNPGKHRGANTAEFLFGKFEMLPENRRRVAIEDIVGSPVMMALAEGRMPAGSYLPVAQLGPRVVEAAGARTPVVRLSADSAAHILEEHADRGLTVSEFREAVSVVTSPEATIRTPAGLIALGIAGGRWWRVVLKSAADGNEWWLVSFHRKSEKAAKSAIRSAQRQGRVIE